MTVKSQRPRTEPVSAYPGFRWLALLLAALGFVDMQMTVLSLAPVLPQIASSLHINVGAATIALMSSFLFSGCLMWVLVGGHICDRLGVFVSLMLGFLCLALPAALMPWIGFDETWVFWARIVEGLSSGLMFPVIPAIAKTLFPPNQNGQAIGWMNAAIATGSSSGVCLGPMIYALAGGDWKRMSAAISLLGWVGLALGVVLYFLYNQKLPRHEKAAADPEQIGAFRRALFSPLTILGVATTVAAGWGLQCILSLTSTYLAADRPLGAGYGSVVAGRLALGATFVGGVIGPLVSGYLLDRVFHGRAKWMLYIGFGLMCVFVFALTLPVVAGNGLLLECALILAGLGSMFAFPTTNYLVASCYPSQIVGKMSGLWGGIGSFGGVVGLYIAGLTIKAFNSYHATFLVQSLVAALGMVLTFYLTGVRKRTTAPLTSPAAASASAD
jgi:MFS family permease